MSNEELYIKFQELVEEIKKQTFDVTEEEIKIQQILYFDKYVKENIEYGFDAINFNIKYPNKKNPYESAFEIEGFFKENEFNGKRQAVCGSISKVANIVLSKLGTKCEYVWGYFNIGSNEKTQYVGHRWNVITIENKKYMVDFTIGMIIHNFNLSNDYANASKHLLGIIDNCKEYDYLFY